jgi:hypothetical protein
MQAIERYKGLGKQRQKDNRYVCFEMKTHYSVLQQRGTLFRRGVGFDSGFVCFRDD